MLVGDAHIGVIKIDVGKQGPGNGRAGIFGAEVGIQKPGAVRLNPEGAAIAEAHRSGVGQNDHAGGRIGQDGRVRNARAEHQPPARVVHRARIAEGERFGLLGGLCGHGQGVAHARQARKPAEQCQTLAPSDLAPEIVDRGGELEGFGFFAGNDRRGGAGRLPRLERDLGGDVVAQLINAQILLDLVKVRLFPRSERYGPAQE